MAIKVELSSQRDVLVRRPVNTGVDKLKSTKVKKNGKALRREWTKADLKELQAYSKARTPVTKISKATKRTIGALRQKAFQLGIGLGHQRFQIVSSLERRLYVFAATGLIESLQLC
jgi:hypothetical protein